MGISDAFSNTVSVGLYKQVALESIEAHLIHQDR
jgi:hypothetical protein